MIFIVFVSAPLTLFLFNNNGASVVIGIITLFILNPLLIIIHEVIHLIVCTALGGRIFGVQIGVGKVLYQRWFKDFYLGIGNNLGSNFTLGGFEKPEKNYKYLLFFGMPLLFHLVACLLPIVVNVYTGEFLKLNWFWTPFVILNGVLLVINLWPRNLATPFGSTKNDGLRVLDILRGVDSNKNFQEDFNITGLMAYINKGDFHKAHHYLEQLKKINPEHFAINNSEAFLLEKEGKWDSALELFKKDYEKDHHHENPYLNDFMMAMAHNNYAWGLLGHESEEERQQAIKAANLAYEYVFWIPSVVGTKAAVYARNGKYSAGVKLAQEAIQIWNHSFQMGTWQKDDGLATNYVTLAYAAHKLGHHTAAKKYWTKAEEHAAQSGLEHFRWKNIVSAELYNEWND